MNQPPGDPYQFIHQNFQQGFNHNNNEYYQFQGEYFSEPDSRIQFAPPIEVLLAQGTYPEFSSQGFTGTSSNFQNPYNPCSQGSYNPGCQGYEKIQNNYYSPQPFGFPESFENKIPNNNLPTNNTKFPMTYTNPPKTSKKGDYFEKAIENEMVLRSEMIGEIGSGQHQFDDYFEKHVEKFFTPEIHQITFFHDDYNLIGLQTTYRDPWGTMIEKETYHGDLHLSKNICGYYTKSVLNLAYDEYLTELYIDAQDRITFVRLVTNNGQVLQLGQGNEGSTLQNLALPSTRVMGFGGSYDIYLRSIYIYYN